MIGKVLSNRYEILDQIGIGGMAVVYKARCRLLNRYVAIKVLREEFNNDEQIVKKFNIESQSAASLSNPNIVSIYDVGQDNGIYYIVMELVEGITLKEYIERSGMMNWHLALKFTLQICNALDHAHRKGIIHRDIKPQNIILTKEGVCKVTDFGIAFTGNMNETRKIETDIMGSVHYISPEQTKGIVTDARSDIYSLGVTVYEMLTAKVPFDGENAVAIAIKHLNEEPTPIKDINLPVPLGFVKIVQKAMNKNINSRYQTVKEMIDDLERLSEDPDVYSVGEQDNPDLSMTRLITKDEHAAILKQIEEIKAESIKEKHEPTPPPEPVKTEDKDTKKDTDVRKKDNFIKNLFKAESKQDKIAVIAAVITSVILIAAISTVALNMLFPSFGLFSLFSSDNKELKITNLEGKMLEDVKEEYKDYKIDFIIDEEVYDSDYEEGVIISHKPSEGMTVKLPTKIHVVVSKGSKEFKLSNYIGKDAKQAKLELNNLNLKVEESLVYDSSIESGYIISQSPLGGSTVRSGDVIKLTISKGTEDTSNVVVPNLIGKTEAEASSALSNSNLKIGSVIKKSSSVAAGLVIDQSIAEDSKVPPNTKIDIYVSNGKPAVSTQEPNTNTPVTPEPTPEPSPQPETPAAPVPEPSPQPETPSAPAIVTIPSDGTGTGSDAPKINAN